MVKVCKGLFIILIVLLTTEWILGELTGWGAVAVVVCLCGGVHAHRMVKGNPSLATAVCTPCWCCTGSGGCGCWRDGKCLVPPVATRRRSKLTVVGRLLLTVKGALPGEPDVASPSTAHRCWHKSLCEVTKITFHSKQIRECALGQAKHWRKKLLLH